MSRTTSDINQKIIMRADASMKAEGFRPSRDVKRDGYAMLEGKISADRLVVRYVNKHSKRTS